MSNSAGGWNIYEERRKHDSRRSVTVGALLLGIVLVAGLAVFCFALADRVLKDRETHTIRGQMTLIDSDVSTASGRCSGTGGYSDIREGASVTVKDEEGTVIGIGSLGLGRPEDRVVCVLPFEVTGVKDADFFQVEVSHRGGLTYSKAEMKTNGWTVDASLGS